MVKGLGLRAYGLGSGVSALTSEVRGTGAVMAAEAKEAPYVVLTDSDSSRRHILVQAGLAQLVVAGTKRYRSMISYYASLLPMANYERCMVDTH